MEHKVLERKIWVQNIGAQSMGAQSEGGKVGITSLYKLLMNHYFIEMF